MYFPSSQQVLHKSINELLSSQFLRSSIVVCHVFDLFISESTCLSLLGMVVSGLSSNVSGKQWKVGWPWNRLIAIIMEGGSVSTLGAYLGSLFHGTKNWN